MYMIHIIVLIQITFYKTSELVIPIADRFINLISNHIDSDLLLLFGN